jgi:hypothetical protein
MEATFFIQGRKISEEDIWFIRRLISENPDLHRKDLSIKLAELWNWRNACGKLKDMSCRNFMLKLHRQGRIVLPAPLRPPIIRKKSFPEQPHSKLPIVCFLKELLPLQIKLTTPSYKQHPLFRSLLSKYHYLDYHRPIGENIGYLVYDNSNRPLACLLFGAAAWRTAPRDSFIGWSSETRVSNLQFIANNSRFLILPWVKVPCLASYLLGAISRRISKDWICKYNHPVYLLETFVEKHRFHGTCYKAANWIYLGDTKGRTRNDINNERKAPVKEIYVYPLKCNFKKFLKEDKLYEGAYTITSE